MSDDPLDFAIDLEDVRERLLGLSYFVAVEDVATASELFDQDGFNFPPPAAFVSVATETAEPNKLVGGHSQRVGQTLSVLCAEASARADRNTRDPVEAARKAVIRQLIGWTPKGAGAPLNYSRYLIRATGGGLVWFEVLFTTSYRLTI